MNWDYIAGIFDGEGSVIIRKHERIKFQISNTHKNTLNQIRDFLKCGMIYQQNRNLHKWKIAYTYVVYKQPEVINILNNLKDKCIIKQSKILSALELHKNKKPPKPQYKYLDIMKLVELRCEKRLSLREIAKEFNVSYTTVKNRLRELRRLEVI